MTYTNFNQFENSRSRIPVEHINSVKKSKESYVNGWLKEINPRLKELLNLRNNWGDKGSIAVLQNVAEIAVKLLNALYMEGKSAPAVTTCGDGSLQLDWTGKIFEISIDIELDCLTFFRQQIPDGKEDEFKIKKLDDLEISKIKDWLSELE